MPERRALGIDLGTSGARAVLIDASGRVLAEGRAPIAARRDPGAIWAAVAAAVAQALAARPGPVTAVAVDGTSGTMLPVDAEGRPLAPARLYNDPCEDPAILAAIAAHAPAESAAHGPTSGLARAMIFAPLRPHRVLHEADWIAFRLSGRMATDANNALKTGYDPVAGRWPGWIAATGLDPALLPEVHDPGTPLGPATGPDAAALGLAGARVVAGTTDGCASFLATGADRPGDGVTALGSTLTLKILSDRPIFAPEFGIYSHRLRGAWLAGGASNSGGAALLTQFTAAGLDALSARIDPEADTGIATYPLPAPGERFPTADPALPPLWPDPALPPELRLHAALEGIAAIEAQGYARLAALGGPPLATLRSVGGGAGNAAWTRIRARRLGVPMPPARSTEAAYGTALLALGALA